MSDEMDVYDKCMERVSDSHEYIVRLVLQAHVSLLTAPEDKKLRKALIRTYNYFSNRENFINE
jgi:hypothetical protein